MPAAKKMANFVAALIGLIAFMEKPRRPLLSTSYKSRPSPSAWTRVEADLLFFTQRCIERVEDLTHGFDSLV